MVSKYFKIILLLIFLTTTILVVVIQYNSIKNINELVAGNENLLTEFRMKNKLQLLQNQVLTIDNKVRSAIIRNNLDDPKLIDEQVIQVRTIVQDLRHMLMTDSSKQLWYELHYLTEEKIGFSKSILDTFSASGKQAAEYFINTHRGLRRTESINRVSKQLEYARQSYLTEIVRETDANSLRARRFGFVLAAVAIAIVLLAFWFISYWHKRQQQLIEQLNESERIGKQAATVKEHFIANMSHEIRTPMNAILGFTNLLQKQSLDNKSAQFVDSICKSSEKLLSIINDVLDLSKIEAGMMRIEKSPFQLAQILQSVENMLYPKAIEKKLSLSYTIDEKIPGTLMGDSVRITQVLVNLVSNAIKFTESGFIRVSALAADLNQNEVLLNLIVEDSGIGIAEEQLPMIFDRFTQAEESTTRRYGGTGLGLSIVQQIIGLHNGTISVKSQPGKGTTFNIKLPLQTATNEQPVNPVKFTDAAPATVSENTMKILVVEDNALNQMLMQHLLEAWHYPFKIAGNGRTAIEILQSEAFNLVLMDIQMPEMDGYTATKLIRSELKSLVPIVAMTAHAFEGEREKCINCGMNDYLSKPIREKELAAIIERYNTSAEPGTEQTVQHQLKANNGAEKTINLAYLKEISGGNKKFERDILEQFMLQAPEELLELEKAYDDATWQKLKSRAHNLKTTTSFLGLQPLLLAHLETLENLEVATANGKQISDSIDEVIFICNNAIKEAKDLLSTTA